MARWIVCTGVAFLTGCATAHRPVPMPVTLSAGWQLQDVAKLGGDARGEAISSPAYRPRDWQRATVPGTVLTSLVNNGVYPEPLYGENNRPDVIPESLCRTSYWYRTTVDVPARDAGRRLWLNFEGINYIAEVWVNGTQVGTIRGAFSRGRFDVTGLVTPGRPAAIAVKILPPPSPGNPLEQTQALGTGPNGGILSQDGPTFLCTLGWDWIPPIRDRNVGIWQKVTLAQTGPAVIEDPLVVTDLPLPRTDSADLSVSATVRNVTDKPVDGVLSGAIEGTRFERSVTLAANEKRLIKFTAADTRQLHFDKPRLWWPNTYGPQNLYTLDLRFRANGVESDRRDVTFGVREITYHVPGSDNLTIGVNGVPIICKGGDWGMDEAMKRIPRDRLEAQIRLHQLANYTMIRNWVGQSTEEDFYDLCDRYGILLWDEFFQPNPSDGPNPVDAEMYIANVREKVLRYRNHASIALWCGRNEGDPPPHINDGIQKIMDELEPVRLYQHNSNDGRGVRSGGPYHWRQPAQYYAYQPAETFKTELGSVSIPTVESIHAMMPAKDWNTFNDDWASHDLLKGAQQGPAGPYWNVIAERYGTFSDLDGFVRRAQLANYESYRAMYEGRFAKLFAPVTGVLTWMSNPAQPSMVWQIYAYDLEPNASLFATRKACEPVHVQMNQDTFRVSVVNATPTARAGLRARLRVFDLDATCKLDQRREIDAAANAATDVCAIDWPANLSTVHFVKLELLDADGKLVSDNFYWRTTKTFAPATVPTATTTTSAPTTGVATTTRPARFRPPQPPREDFTMLQSLPPTAVDVQTSSPRERDGTVALDATVTNRGASIALLVHLQLRKAASDDRVLPVYYSDNYVSLLPGETKTIAIEAARRDAGDGPPRVVLDGWNVQASTRPKKGDITDFPKISDVPFFPALAGVLR